MSKKKVLLIADVRNWAFDNIAQFLKPILAKSYDIEVLYTEDYKSPKDLLKALSAYLKIDFIHFFYRGYLKMLLEEGSSWKDKSLLDSLYKSAINTAVTDHLFIENQSDILDYQQVLKFVDNYYTTSKKLYDIYAGINYYPKPKGVIFDNIEVKSGKINLDNNKKLLVAWIGNSAWGQWCYGKDNDVKGYNSIIKPALEKLQNVDFCIIDSQKNRYTKEEVFNVLKRIDILLIASSTEATPLPLIEAMSQGCAVVITDVGIAAEVLPKSQKPFIIVRDEAEFVSKITQLDKDRKLLTKVKKDNLEAYEKIFRNENFFFKKWSDLIESSIKNAESRIEQKKRIMDEIAISQKKTFFGKVKNLVLKVLKGKKLKTIIKKLLKFPPLNLSVRQIIYFFNYVNEGSIEAFAKALDAYSKSVDPNNKEDRILALYHSSYPGVANSTKALFKHTVALPSYGFIDLIGLPGFIATKIAKAILASKVEKLIISGGSKSINQVIDRMYELEPNTKIECYFLWHGSPAQWSEKFHLEYTSYSFDLYRKGRYKAVITLKKDLEKALEAYNIKSYLLQNFVPNNSNIKPSSDEKFTIGIWSAYALWVKNLYPQLMSISVLKGDIACHTNFDKNNEGGWVCDVYDTKIYPSYMQHSDLLEAMSKTDITLYVTNTECSPMIALESLSIGIPCIVGPTSGLYDSDQYLKEMLTVSRVDSPADIAKAIERARGSIFLIKAKIPAFIEAYNEEAKDLKAKFVEAISKKEVR